MDWLVYILPKRWLIHVCQQAQTWHAVSSRFDVENEVIRILNDVVVKCRWDVKPGEGAMQKYAAQKLNHHGIVCVPHVYRYFPDHSTRPVYPWPKGYLFMEYIPGPPPKQEGLDFSCSATAEDICECLAEAFLELSSVADDNNAWWEAIGRVLVGR